MTTNTGHQRPASLDSRTTRHALAAFVLVLLSIAGAAVHAQTVLAGQWLPQGPAPALDGQTENVAPNDEVTGAVHVVLPHPSDADVLYAGGTNAGVWKTTNATASQPTWTELTDSFVSLSIGARAFDSADATHRTIYAGTGRFSSYGDGTWTAMELPTTSEDDGEVFGIHPGGQGSIHMSIAADPTDPQIVYVGGDRQPCFIERSDPPPESCFPNSLGATDYSGRLFRVDASAAAGSQWTPLTHGGTASDSSPHADSREMAFDAVGDLLEADDGGVYRRTQPRTGAGDWFSLNANLAATEYHGIAYDAVSDIIIGGAQDTGTTEQLLPGGAIFASVSTADGGDPAVDDTSSTTQSTRYSSFQFLNGFRRRVVDADNNVPSDTILVQSLIDAGPASSRSSTRPWSSTAPMATGC